MLDKGVRVGPGFIWNWVDVDYGRNISVTTFPQLVIRSERPHKVLPAVSKLAVFLRLQGLTKRGVLGFQQIVLD